MVFDGTASLGIISLLSGIVSYCLRKYRLKTHDTKDSILSHFFRSQFWIHTKRPGPIVIKRFTSVVYEFL
jgi:hypothetical protein